ncbi:hypothetical protein IQ226_13920 [Dolichospermum sp. LEGE 00240]|uniref:hypothetical protein n=1 Tax=Dolichospermum sp. LEGE 00240 TaxID=1828603 RepID=UPI001881FED0|nr:hypothetical protein [Dolichospermum sp. LEGE 00240]MBE9250226.1 hypothetical protein [Dolichospermum sp. LEGE 00240]MDM3847968.1 hypothetical protein [Aphanizomenon gracile PMC638.10]MDM3853288.1 hypothetical protein [Aphanizomenon gracile PMC627.10]MDM3854531.1 hypothetical protein [Aphanizomenon gracile PMC649.10]
MPILERDSSIFDIVNILGVQALEESGVRSSGVQEKKERSSGEGRNEEITNYQLPITHYQFPIPNSQLPITRNLK